MDYFLKNQRRLKADLARNARRGRGHESCNSPRGRSGRSAKPVYQANLPPLGAEDRALAVELNEQIAQLASSKSVQIVSQSPGVRPTRQPEYTSVSAQLETTSTWPALSPFCTQLQGPGNFLVFENANLKRDDKDETQMRCTFKIASWFAPKPKPKLEPTH